MQYFFQKHMKYILTYLYTYNNRGTDKLPMPRIYMGSKYKVAVLLFLLDQIIRQRNKDAATNNISKCYPQKIVKISCNGKSCHTIRTHQSDCHHTHVCNTMLESAHHENKDTPEDHDQFSGFCLHLCTAPYCQTNHQVTHDTFHKQLAGCSTHLGCRCICKKFTDSPSRNTCYHEHDCP